MRLSSNSQTSARIYDTIISNTRLGATDNPGRDIIELALSDQARVVYSSAFRRLQAKTQVFALAPNAALRSRLTHSVEVASVGRWIAHNVVNNLYGITPSQKVAIPLLVETACLAHDIGNPPFGHFGEDAIKEWFRSNGNSILAKSIGEGMKNSPDSNQLLSDFYSFDGNPQGIRILARLQGRTKDERIEKGMNLTCTQILTCLKYPRNPSYQSTIWKKPGYFHSEADIVEACWNKVHNNLQNRRFPLTYLVEAADDISYCLSDLEDGIDQRLVNSIQIFDELTEWAKQKSESEPMAELRKVLKDCKENLVKKEKSSRDSFLIFKTNCTAKLIKRASDLYFDLHDQVIKGEIDSLFALGGEEDNLLKSLKRVASSNIYPSDPVEIPFISGKSIINKILEAYRPMLELQIDSFKELLIASDTGNRSKVNELGFSMGLPLFNRLPKNYIEIYIAQADKPQGRYNRRLWEWFCRTHLIVDFVSGMADDFAVRFYKRLSGELRYDD